MFQSMVVDFRQILDKSFWILLFPASLWLFSHLLAMFGAPECLTIPTRQLAKGLVVWSFMGQGFQLSPHICIDISQRCDWFPNGEILENFWWILLLASKVTEFDLESRKNTCGRNTSFQISLRFCKFMSSNKIRMQRNEVLYSTHPIFILQRLAL